MEKRNVVEDGRTPCKRLKGKASFCDCEACVREKRASDRVTDINDTEGLARVHK